MAWIKVQDVNGKIFTVPEPAYENFFKENGSLRKVETPTEPKGEERKDDEIQQPKQDENKPRRKNTSKTSIQH